MRMLAEFFPEFAEKLDELDQLYAEKRTIDKKKRISLSALLYPLKGAQSHAY